MRLGLELAGYEVESARNGPECVLKLCGNLPDFLIADIDMPPAMGRELCHTIDKQFPHREFPILALSSRSEREFRDWAYDISNLDFMEKPISVRRLVAKVGELLETTEQECGS